MRIKGATLTSSEENTTIEESAADDSKDSTTEPSTDKESDNGRQERQIVEDTSTLAQAVPARVIEVNVSETVVSGSDFAPPSAQSIAEKVDASLSLYNQQSENVPKATSRQDRQGWLKGSLLTFKYLNEISKDKKLAFRASDKTTTWLLLFALIGSIVFALGPHFGFAAFALICYVTADLMLILGIAIFVVTRFGIIRAMEPRYALICWHLMVGTGLLALVLGFNIVAGLVLFIMRDKFLTLTGGGI